MTKLVKNYQNDHSALNLGECFARRDLSFKLNRRDIMISMRGSRIRSKKISVNLGDDDDTFDASYWNRWYRLQSKSRNIR